MLRHASDGKSRKPLLIVHFFLLSANCAGILNIYTTASLDITHGGQCALLYVTRISVINTLAVYEQRYMKQTFLYVVGRDTTGILWRSWTWIAVPCSFNHTLRRYICWPTCRLVITLITAKWRHAKYRRSYCIMVALICFMLLYLLADSELCILYDAEMHL